MTSTLKTNAIEPEGATTNLVIGESGQNTVIGNNDIRANVLQDAGGNAIFTSDGSGNMSGVNSGFGSAMVLLSTQTASNAATVSFTSGIDSTFREYIFKCYNINPATDSAFWQFQGSIDGGSSYGVTVTTSAFRAIHGEGGAYTTMGYLAGQDLAQSTDFIRLMYENGNGADENSTTTLHLFNPASTTYAKHFHVRTLGMHSDNNAIDWFGAGYFNTTDNIDAIQFKMTSGNFDGKIKMWGVK